MSAPSETVTSGASPAPLAGPLTPSEARSIAHSAMAAQHLGATLRLLSGVSRIR